MSGAIEIVIVVVIVIVIGAGTTIGRANAIGGVDRTRR
jgi:hypothetical protein